MKRLITNQHRVLATSKKAIHIFLMSFNQIWRLLFTRLIRLSILLCPLSSISQCNVVIKEIFFSPMEPTTGSAASNSLHDIANINTTAEWVELYNPSSCTSVDISCWILGSDESNGGFNFGAFVFPNGTIIPPLGFIVVGGNAATPKDFNSQTSPNYCGSNRWYLTNTDGWIALYTKTGTIIDAVYWSSTGSGSLNTSLAYNNAVNSHSSPLPCSCSGTTLNSTLAKNIPGIEFAGNSAVTTTVAGYGFERTTDGSNTWALETHTQSTPKACNGVCVLPLSATIAGTNPPCGGIGSATVAASGASPAYTYSWSNGATTAITSNLAGGTHTCTITDACGCSITKTISTVTPPSPFTVAITNTHVACFGGNNGSATATTISVSGTSTYTWNTTPSQNTQTANGLTAGNYTVTVFNNGCTATQTVTITQPSQLVVGTSASPAICNGPNGSTTAAPSGGTPGYTYSWQPTSGTTATANNLMPGNYTVTVTDINLCVKTVTVNVANTSPTITIGMSSTPANCTSNNGTATSNPSGGTAPYTYTWSTNPLQNTQTANNLSSATYTVNTTDNNGCSNSQTVTVNNIGNLSSTISGTNEICGAQNGSITITPSGGNGPYTYTWSTTPPQNTPTAINLPGGAYTATITDVNGCITSSTYSITNITTIGITSATTPAVCLTPNGTAIANPTAGAAPFTYTWTTNPVQNTQTATNLAVGIYSCAITDNLGCATTITVQIIANTPTLTSIGSQTAAICTNSNGIASVAATSGTAPYTYT